MNRALIVSPAGETCELIGQVLAGEGFSKTAHAASGSEARRIIGRDTEPELIVINAPLSDEFGQELAELAAEVTSAGLILICGSDIADDVADISPQQNGPCGLRKPEPNDGTEKGERRDPHQD